MKMKAGTAFNLTTDNAPIPGCTVSNRLTSPSERNVTVFSLASHTDISAEMHPADKLLIALSGRFTAGIDGNGKTLSAGEGLLVPSGSAFGVVADTDSVFLDISLGKEVVMNDQVKSGAPFALADLVPYRNGQIVNMDVAHTNDMKFALMAFDEGTGLDEHAAPGEALVFALEGEGIIGYEGQEYPIKAGENFKFDKGGKHYVKANGRFKMALLLIKE